MTEKPRAADPEATGSAPGGSTTAGGSTNGASAVDGATAPADTASAGTVDPTAGTGPADGADATDGATEGPESPAGQADEPETADTAGGAEATAGDGDEEEGTGGAGSTPAAPVADEEIAEVLAAETPTGPEGPVVDEPAEPTESVEMAESVVGESGGRSALGAELEALRAELDERTRDLQRVSAEYANYRKRVDRDRGLVADQATGVVLVALLPILDDLDRAREHGDLVGPFGTVAEQLVSALGKFGLTPFGEPGDPFDPTRHEAVAHQTSAEVTESTCVTVMRRGYLHGDRLLRPALVGVADPE